MTYGIMPEQDYRTMDAILEKVLEDFPDTVVNTLEIGVHRGLTSMGIRNFVNEKGRQNYHIGIDNLQDTVRPIAVGIDRSLIGDSHLMFSQVADNSQHFIFIDGNHSLRHTKLDFLSYRDKLKKYGYIAFHDSGKMIKPFTDYQKVGDVADADNYICCRRAIMELELFESPDLWELVFDVADETKHTGGITCFRKLY